MALERFGGVGGVIRKAIPYVLTYVFGKKMGERDTRNQAEEETEAARERAARAGQKVSDELKTKSTGDYIRNKDI
ncbi:MAG: hypothetical protein U1E17_23480 [Geminicoccaceae bacterium]